MVAKNKLTYPNSRPTVAPAKAVEIGNEKSIIKEAMDFMERRLND